MHNATYQSGSLIRAPVCSSPGVVPYMTQIWASHVTRWEKKKKKQGVPEMGSRDTSWRKIFPKRGYLWVRLGFRKTSSRGPSMESSQQPKGENKEQRKISDTDRFEIFWNVELFTPERNKFDFYSSGRHDGWKEGPQITLESVNFVCTCSKTCYLYRTFQQYVGPLKVHRRRNLAAFSVTLLEGIRQVKRKNERKRGKFFANAFGTIKQFVAQNLPREPDCPM